MWDSLLTIFKMEQVMIPGEYFLSVKYNQVYIGEMCVHFFVKYKWQTNCTCIITFAIKLDMQMAEVFTVQKKLKESLIYFLKHEYQFYILAI